MKAAINKQVEEKRAKLKRETTKPPAAPPGVIEKVEKRKKRLNDLGKKNRPIGWAR